MLSIRLHEWFGFGVFASCTAAGLIDRLLSQPTGRWASEDAVNLIPLMGFLIACAAAIPLYLRTFRVDPRQFRQCFAVPLGSGLLYIPFVMGTISLAEAICPSVVEAVVLAAALGWSIGLGEVVYRACRVG